MEVLVACTLLALMAGGILGATNFGFYSMNSARENLRATQILLEKLETIRLYNWDQINQAGFVPSAFTAVYDPQKEGDTQGRVYYGTMSIGPASNVPEAYGTNMRVFTVSLLWTNGNGVARSRTFSTMVSKDGVQNYVY